MLVLILEQVEMVIMCKVSLKSTINYSFILLLINLTTRVLRDCKQ